MKVAEKILEQLGGQKFIAMTGANHFVADGNTLRMALPKNASKANRLYITLDATDTYTMHFFKYTAGHLIPLCFPLPSFRICQSIPAHRRPGGPALPHFGSPGAQISA